MKKHLLIAALLAPLWTAILHADESSRVVVVIPSAQEEADYIWRNLNDTVFFEEFGYEVSYPLDPIIERLKVKARSRELTESDYRHFVDHFENSIYRRENYKAGYRQVEDVVPLLTEMMAQLSEEAYPWGFRVFEEYRVVLTLYGPGGSYDPENGSAVLFTTSNGDFKRYENPANTLIHEFIHIGIETSIIQRFQVPHGLKERIVDNLVMLHFSDQLPGYRMQEMGDPAIDDLLPDKASIRRLDEIVPALTGE